MKVDALVTNQRPARKSTPVEQLRTQHCMEVVLALRDHGSCSRLDLCHLIKRSTTTMTKVIADLMAYGWVEETEVVRSRDLGRPRIFLRLVPESVTVLSLIIEPDAVHSAVVGLDLLPKDNASYPMPVSEQDSMQTIAELASIINNHIFSQKVKDKSPLQSVAIVLPGMTDTRLRTSIRAPFLGWKDLDIAGYLEPLIGLPVVVYNNTRAMGFAEFRHLKLHEDEPMLFVQARFGLGASWLNSSTPNRYSHYGVSELGRIPFCINYFSKLVPTDSNLRSVTNEAYLRTVLSARAGDGPVIPLLEKRRDEKDTVALLLYEQTLDNLANGLGIAVNLLKPSIIVLGGIYADASQKFMTDLEARIKNNVEEELTQGMKIQCTQLGRTGALQGAAIIAFDRLLRNSTTYHPV